MRMAEPDPIVIAGAGVAGLSAAYRLQGHANVPFLVYERAPYVGGYSRTIQHGDSRFDLGGHRFYTKKPHVQQVVEEVVGDDLLVVDRLSRILFNGRFVDYPLTPLSTLTGLGPGGAVKAVLDYAVMKARKLVSEDGPEETFEQWALSRFGRYLYEVYFRVYTEKTWGVPCTELSADFAHQRIKGLSFREAVRDAVLRKGGPDTLVRRFLYPRYGFGQIPDGMAGAVTPPSAVLTEHAIVEVEHEDGKIRAVKARGPDRKVVRRTCCEFISSIPVDELVGLLRPAPPAPVLEAAQGLVYRSVVILFLALDVEQVSPDHWIYIPSSEIGFCRLHEPKNWSKEMAPSGKTGLVLEYFCQEGDACWNRDVPALATEATRQLTEIGLIEPDWLMDQAVVRLRKAYPVYRVGYAERVNVITEYLRRFRNLYNVGRNASFLYTSSDHYIDMGLKAAENVLGHDHDLDAIGREQAYAETWDEGER